MRNHPSDVRHRADRGAEQHPGARGHHHAGPDEQGEHGGRAFRRREPGDGPRGPRGGGPRGHFRRGGPRFADFEPTPVSTEAITSWLTGRLPGDWFAAAPTVEVDRDEITVVGTLADTPDGAGAEAEEGRISRFREDTREQRMAIAREAEQRYDRRVAWGAVAGGTTALFTTASVPVMTRLRQPERQVLDTLVDAGVARSRSEALGWCVRLVARNTDAWLGRLREAMTEVERVREEGPEKPADED